ncbi:MAG: hypothetical protein ACLSFI_07065 [Christensenellaceae bacterium]|nr:hypothetical protein [Christensenellaceae bacterium]
MKLILSHICGLVAGGSALQESRAFAVSAAERLSVNTGRSQDMCVLSAI